MLNLLRICVFIGSIFSSLYADKMTHYGTVCKAQASLEKEAYAIEKIHKLRLISSGMGRMAGSKIAPFGLLFTSQEKYTIDQAKALSRDVANRILMKMYEDPHFAKYYSTGTKCQFVPKEQYRVHLNSLAFRIDFWDENVDRMEPPYCAEIRYADGFFYYYLADPKTQALQEPIVEPCNLVERNPVTS